jgi:hypothetical protein
LAIIALSLKFQPTLSFAGMVLQLAVLPAMIAKFRMFFSKTSVIASMLAFGAIINVVLLYSVLHTENPDLGIALTSLMIYTLVIIPDAAATSLLADEKAKSWEIFAFYFWFLISVGLAILFLMSSNSGIVHSARSNPSPPFQLLALLVLYLELAAIPSLLVLLYKRFRVFLVFIPLPLLLGYALLFTGWVGERFV